MRTGGVTWSKVFLWCYSTEVIPSDTKHRIDFRSHIYVYFMDLSGSSISGKYRYGKMNRGKEREINEDDA